MTPGGRGRGLASITRAAFLRFSINLMFAITVLMNLMYPGCLYHIYKGISNVKWNSNIYVSVQRLTSHNNSVFEISIQARELFDYEEVHLYIE